MGRDLKLLARFGALGLTLLMAGCGVINTTLSVQNQTKGTDVRVVKLDHETVLVANRQAYAPKSLPAAFYATAGGGSYAGVQGVVPAPPFVPSESRQSLILNAPPVISPRPYRIGVGDVVALATKGGVSTIEELSGLLAAQNNRQGFTVRDDGVISIPDIGTVHMAGLTLEEAEARLFQVMVENQLNPAFSLEISEFNSKHVSIGGAVGSAALVPITLRPLELGDALTVAGGLSVSDQRFASIRIYREGTLYQIPVKEFFGKPDLQKIQILAGDAIYVDTTYDLDKAQAYYQQQINAIGLRRSARAAAIAELQTEVSLRQQAISEQRGSFQARLSLDAEERDYIYLVGELSQSRYTMPFERQISLADVIYDNGGFPTTGDAAHIYVLRPSPDPKEFGAVTAWHLNAVNVANLTIASKMEMRPDDIVFIRAQPLTRWNRALQQFFPILINAGTQAISGP